MDWMDEGEDDGGVSSLQQLSLSQLSLTNPHPKGFLSLRVDTLFRMKDDRQFYIECVEPGDDRVVDVVFEEEYAPFMSKAVRKKDIMTLAGVVVRKADETRTSDYEFCLVMNPKAGRGNISLRNETLEGGAFSLSSTSIPSSVPSRVPKRATKVSKTATNSKTRSPTSLQHNAETTSTSTCSTTTSIKDPKGQPTLVARTLAAVSKGNGNLSKTDSVGATNNEKNTNPYEYTTLGSVWNKYHSGARNFTAYVYGVVQYITEVRATRNDPMVSMTISDSTWTNSSDGLKINLFAKVAKALPSSSTVQIGDIVRFNRLKIQSFDGGPQGLGNLSKRGDANCIVFRGGLGTGFVPYHISTGTGVYSLVHKDVVHSLRAWAHARDSFAMSSVNPMLFEIEPSDDIVSIVVQFIGFVSSGTWKGIVVWDGSNCNNLRKLPKHDWEEIAKGNFDEKTKYKVHERATVIYFKDYEEEYFPADCSCGDFLIAMNIEPRAHPSNSNMKMILAATAQSSFIQKTTDDFRVERLARKLSQLHNRWEQTPSVSDTLEKNKQCDDSEQQRQNGKRGKETEEDNEELQRKKKKQQQQPVTAQEKVNQDSRKGADEDNEEEEDEQQADEQADEEEDEEEFKVHVKKMKKRKRRKKKRLTLQLERKSPSSDEALLYESDDDILNCIPPKCLPASGVSPKGKNANGHHCNSFEKEKHAQSSNNIDDIDDVDDAHSLRTKDRREYSNHQNKTSSFGLFSIHGDNATKKKDDIEDDGDAKQEDEEGTWGKKWGNLRFERLERAKRNPSSRPSSTMSSLRRTSVEGPSLTFEPSCKNGQNLPSRPRRLRKQKDKGANDAPFKVSSERAKALVIKASTINSGNIRRSKPSSVQLLQRSVAMSHDNEGKLAENKEEVEDVFTIPTCFEMEESPQFSEYSPKYDDVLSDHEDDDDVMRMSNSGLRGGFVQQPQPQSRQQRQLRQRALSTATAKHTRAESSGSEEVDSDGIPISPLRYNVGLDRVDDGVDSQGLFRRNTQKKRRKKKGDILLTTEQQIQKATSNTLKKQQSWKATSGRGRRRGRGKGGRRGRRGRSGGGSYGKNGFASDKGAEAFNTTPFLCPIFIVCVSFLLLLCISTKEVLGNPCIKDKD
eukprot:m.110662 g.110662  ORF g.110662 m.110662 type:complete len:1128 (+) comp12754_c2_seq2:55-3438(+)